MAIDDPDLVAEFVIESRDHLAHVEGQLLEVEAGGADVNVDLVNTVFRGIHSIKGAAGFLGLTTVNALAHSLENVLGRMRNRELTPTPAIVDVMLKAADSLTQLINDVEASELVDVSVHVAALDRIAAEVADDLTEPRPATTRPDQTSSIIGIRAPTAIVPAACTQTVVASVIETAIRTTGSVDASTAGPSPGESSIRVQVGVLDSLMNLAGELVLGRNQLMQTLGSKSHEGIDAVAARLNQVTTELQEAIMRTRMQPIGNVFSKFPRVVRDLSAKLGKQCDVQMEGKEVDVDKTILEAIGDPLTHLVRNSIDHGIESPEVRSSRGKNPVGAVALRAYHQAGKIRIDIADDGARIDPARLKEKAVAKGVITAEQANRMDEREAVRLIFHPGFSTAEKVTDVSGRGVGMDVVRTNIEGLGGSVDVESVPGHGTTMQITLPLTLAIIPSLIIRSRGERFAVPQVNVLELVRVRRNEHDHYLARVKDAEVLRLRGELLPLVRLDHVLGLTVAGDEAATASPVNIIVIESGQRRYCLAVDEILDSEEIVVKPMGRHIKSCNCLAGATILGDGHVALILDAAGIAAHVNLGGAQNQKALTANNSGAGSNVGRDVQDLLLFRLSTEEHFAVPMSLVTRIERIQSDAVKTVGSRRLLQYRGASLPLLNLAEYIATQTTPDLGRYFVIVFRAAGREAGLLVPHLDDICQLSLDIDATTFRQKGVAGAFVHNTTTMRLLDVVELAELAHPEWFTESEIEKHEGYEAPLVLVAEDSTFFRRQVSDFLTSKGLDVVGCEDGARAWDYLTSEQHRVQLVITDVEMPNMNGFELCRRIKQHALLSKLPVIALTSLASEADIARGRDAGIDEYQVKMDRERVMEAVTRLLPGAVNSEKRLQTSSAAAPTILA